MSADVLVADTRPIRYEKFMDGFKAEQIVTVQIPESRRGAVRHAAGSGKRNFAASGNEEGSGSRTAGLQYGRVSILPFACHASRRKTCWS
jgi:hypothetical protein